MSEVIAEKINQQTEKLLLKNKKINTSRIEELNEISNFDMFKFIEENPKLEDIINKLILGISRGKTKFKLLTITEKEEVLKNIFIEKEEEI